MYDDFSVFIYCGGKCGSTTLLNTFKENGFKTLHLHGKQHFPTLCKDIVEATGISDFPSFLSYQKSEKIYIIDVYRTPIERKISSFFQNILTHVGENFATVPVDELINIFNRNFLHSIEEYHPLDIELPIFTGKKWDDKREYLIKEEGNRVYIKLRFSSIDRWGQILSSIFNREISVVPMNLSENKIYAHVYKEFKKKYKVDPSYLYALELCPIFRKYMTEKEQREYLKKWR
jgi:hypothetical protein